MQRLRRLAHNFKQAAGESEGFFEHRRRSNEVVGFASDISKSVKIGAQIV